MLTLIAAMFVALAGPDAPPGQTPSAPVRPDRSLDLVPLRARDGSSADARIAADAAHIFPQVYRHWRLRCDDPQFVRERIQFDVTLDRQGRIVSGPTLVNPRDDAAWQATAESARIALISAAPFAVPEGYAGGRYRPTFNVAHACAAD